MNYYLVKLKIRTGELEFSQFSLFQSASGDIDHISEKAAESFYDGPVEKEKEWYSFHGGQTAVKVERAESISSGDFLTLIRLLK